MAAGGVGGCRGRCGCWVGIVAAPLTTPIRHLPGSPNSSDSNTDGLWGKKSDSKPCN